MLEKVKKALRVKTNAYDSELSDLIDTALADLGIAGIVSEVLVATSTEALIRQAIITYCKLHFGTPDNPEMLKLSYDEQKAQLQTATGYTDWLED